jgi:hypothetical protein
MPWTESATTLSADKTVVISKQDALKVSAFQPFVTFSDSNAGNTQSRIQGADGKLVFYTQSALNSGVPTVIFNSLAAPAGQPLPSAVEIHAQDGVQTVGFQPFVTLTDANAGFAKARIQNADGNIVLYSQGGITRAVPEMVLESASGNVHVTGTAFFDDDVKVTGDIRLANADCAEDFNIGTDISVEPGTVMVLGAEGALFPSQHAYDKCVAGVVSGGGDYKPGIVLDKQQSDSNRQPIALLGKVYCKVDAQYGAVEVGNLLTTSPTPGHAMKTSDPFKAFGAVIGKALRPLTEGQGLIPILIALQ